jgi:hypothetical protein
MTLFHEIVTAVLLVLLTLWLQCGGLVALIFWVRRALAADPHRLRPFRSTRTGGATHSCGDRFARSINSVLGRLLSLALPTVVGICCLLLGRQLCHRGVWRRSPAVQLAHVGPVGSIMGILMCGISVSVLFATVTLLVGREVRSAH